MSTSHHRPRSQSPSNVFAERASSDTDTDETLDDGDNTKDRYWRAITELTHTVNGLSSTLSKLSRLQQTTSDSTGWGLLEKTVRGYDEDRIKASTDNIDTLLLFSGLYAAILAAFTVVSLTYLDPDDTGRQTVTLLQQLIDGKANTTATFSRRDATVDVPRPEAWAIRVNALWFASLVISLSSASLGILVRQWLTESLTRSYKSPQKLLRARQYRDDAMSAWAVTDIADVLPMLLEIAVLLFFIGLCEFTAHIHSIIGHTTLPLVIGWGSVLFASFMFPCIFASCPYKSNFLYPIASFIRRSIRIIFISRLQPKDKLDWMVEEDEVVEWRGPKDDVELFLSLDAVVPDAGLLETILEVHDQAGPHPLTATLRFAFMLLSNRIQVDFHTIITTPMLLPTTRLSLSDWQQLTTLVARALEQELFPEKRKAHSWQSQPSLPNIRRHMHQDSHHVDFQQLWLAAICFLVSPTRHELPKASAERLRRRLTRDNHLLYKKTLNYLAVSDDFNLEGTMWLTLRLTGLTLGIEVPTERLEQLLPLGLLDYDSGDQVVRVIMHALRNESERSSSGGDATKPLGAEPSPDLIADAIITLLSASSRALLASDKELLRMFSDIPKNSFLRVLSALDKVLPYELHVGERTVLAVQGLLSLYLPRITVDAEGIPTSLNLSSVPEVVQLLLCERLSENLEERVKFITPTTSAVPHWMKAGLTLMVSVSHRLLTSRQRRVIIGAIRSPVCLRHLLDRPVTKPTGHEFGDKVLSAVRILNYIGHDLRQTGEHRHIWHIPSPMEYEIAPSTYRSLISWISEHWSTWASKQQAITLSIGSSWWAFDAVMIILSNFEPAEDLPTSATNVLLEFARNESCLEACFDVIQYHPGEWVLDADLVQVSAPKERPSRTQTVWAASRFMKAIRSEPREAQMAWKSAWEIIGRRLWEILPAYDPIWSPHNTPWSTMQQHAVCLLLSPLRIRLPTATQELLKRFRSDSGPRDVVLAALGHYRSCHDRPSDLVWLALTLTQYVLGKIIVKGSLDKILDFTGVDKHLQESLAKLVAKALAEPKASVAQTETPTWTIDGVIFLLSIEDGRPQIGDSSQRSALPSEGIAALRECFSGPAAAIATGKRLCGSPFVPLARKLVRACTNGITLKHALALYAPFLCADVQHRHRSLSEVIHPESCPAHPDEGQRERVYDDIRELLKGVAHRIHLPARSSPDLSGEVIMLLGRLSPRAKPETTMKIFTDMWQDKESLGLFWFFAGVHQCDRLDDDSLAGELCKKVLAQKDADQVEKCLSRSCARLEGLRTVRDDPPSHQSLLRSLGPLDPVRLTRLYLQAHERTLSARDGDSVNTSTGSTQTLAELWTLVWKALARLVDKYYRSKDWQCPPRRSVHTTMQPAQASQERDLYQEIINNDRAMAKDCIASIDRQKSRGANFPDQIRSALELALVYVTLDTIAEET